MECRWTLNGIIHALQGLTIDNMQEYFEKEYNRWRFENSHEVTIDGEPIENKWEKNGILWSTKEIKAKECIVSDTTPSNFPLSQREFIEKELRYLEPQYNKTIGDTKNLEFNIKARYYIEFLKAKLENKQVDDYSELYKGLVPTYIQNLSLSDFNEIMTFKRLPNGKDKLKWSGKKKGYCLLLFKNYGFTTAQVSKVFEGKIHDNQLEGLKPTDDFMKLLQMH